MNKIMKSQESFAKQYLKEKKKNMIKHQLDWFKVIKKIENVQNGMTVTFSFPKKRGK